MLIKHYPDAPLLVARHPTVISRSQCVALLVAVLWCSNLQNRAGGKEPAGEPLPGLVSAPRTLPGIGRWQLARKIPRGRIVAIAWNRDATQIAFNDHTYVRLCDTQTFETTKVLAGHASDVTGIDWNHRTNRLASSSCDGTVRVWSDKGIPEKVLKTDAGAVKSVAWTKDGTLLAASTSRGSVWIWNADGSLKATLKGSKAPINSVAWSPDGTRLVSGDEDGHLKLWNPDGKLLRDWNAHLSSVTAVAWSPDGKQFASLIYGEKDPTSERYHSEVRLWAPDGSLTTAIPGNIPFGAVCWSPDSQQIAIYNARQNVRLYDLHGTQLNSRGYGGRLVTLPKAAAWAPQGREIALGGIGELTIADPVQRGRRTSPHDSLSHDSSRPVPAAIGSRDGHQWLARMSADGAYQVWSAAGQSGGSLPEGATQKISRLAWNRAGDQIAFVENGKRLRVWRVGSPSTRLVFESPSPIELTAWSPDGRALATLDEEGNLQVTQIDGKTLLQQKVEAPVVDAQPQSGVSDSVSRLLFRPDGQAVAVVEPKAIRVIPLNGAPVQLLGFEKVLPGGEGNSVWWSNDGTRITSMRKQDKPNQQVVSWDLTTGKRTTITDFSDEIGAIDCSPDGKRIVIGFDIGFWQVRRLDDPAAAPLESEPAAHVSTIRAVAFSRDGRRFATGGWDGLIKIWSSEGTLLATLDGNDWPVYVLNWSTDGQHLSSLTRERTTQLWSLKTGRPVLRFDAAADETVTVITEDGRIFGPPTERLNREFWALVERPSGEMETVGYADFLKRIAGH
jgi:WD40 repeat protein